MTTPFKGLIALLLAFVLFAGCRERQSKDKGAGHEHPVEAPSETTTATALSPHKTAMAMVGKAHVHIDYSAPSTRGRIIFGGLLAYGEIWQAGAHNATWIETDQDLVIAGKELKAGKYGFFAIPTRDRWTLIFNTRWDQHGKDEYRPEEDALRLEVTPQWSDTITEQLTYTVSEVGPGQGRVTLSWEKATVQFLFTLTEKENG